MENSRIRQGVVSLTRAESARLHAMQLQRSLAATVRRDCIDGGGLTPAERRKIDVLQDHLSREIYLQKHDLQRRR